MRVFFAGAAIGRRLVPQLIERRNDVLATHGRPSAPSRSTSTCSIGTRSWRRSSPRPDAIVHQATAPAQLSNTKHFDPTFHQTNLLGTRGTDALIAAAQAAGVTPFVAESYASARHACSGGMVTLLARQRA